MKKENSSRVFVAYSSNEEVSSIMFDGVMRANSRPLSVKFEPWPFNDISGRPLISPIIENIDESPYVVADITIFNLNVVYEIGFAIGRGKRVLLLRYKGVDGDKAKAQKIGIFDTLGYIEYSSAEDVRDILSAHVDRVGLQQSMRLDKKAPVYIVEPLSPRHSDVIVNSRIKKAGFKYRSFNPSEHTRMSATEVLRQVGISSGVVTRLQEPTIRGAELHNVRACFAIGLADGMDKPTLVLAPADANSPLDIRDAIKIYKSPDEIGEFIANFCPNVVSYLTDQDPPLFDGIGPLSTLSIGDPMAENEMTTLARYYLPTDPYHRVMNGNANLVVGRKGSGKTALFIRVRDKIRQDKRNVVVDLKPEGYQLIKFKEDVLKILSAGARQHLIVAFWEYIILLEVANKLLEKDKSKFTQDHSLYEEYVSLRETYMKNRFAYEGDFSERLYTLSSDVAGRIVESYNGKSEIVLTTDQVTNLLHTEDIPKLRDQISRYLDRKTSVWVLFDNLDKGWSTGGVDETDSLITRALIDASRKIEREMDRDGHSFNTVVFVRNDVYDIVMRNSADFGKEMRAVLDWTDPDLLRELLRLRLAIGLGAEGQQPSFSDLWQTLCVSHYAGEESSKVLIDRTLMRPRNLLKIFNHCRGFANNLNKAKVDEEDIEKGLKAYSEDLFTEISRELEDIMPEAANVLYEFLDCPSVLSLDEIKERIEAIYEDSSQVSKVVRFLIYYGVFGLILGDKSLYIYDVNYDLKRIEVRMRGREEDVQFQINKALWPALGTYEVFQDEVDGIEILHGGDSEDSTGARPV